MSTVAPPPVQQMPLLVISTIRSEMRLTIQPLASFWDFTHPADLGAIHIQHLELLALLLQFLGHGFDIDAKVLSQEVTDFRILVVAYERHRGLWIRRVDIHIGGGMAVGGPTGLRTSGNHVGVLVQGSVGIFNQVGYFVVGEVFDSEAG